MRKLVVTEEMLKRSIYLHLDSTIGRYLIVCTPGRENGYELAECHIEMCKFIIEVVKGKDTAYGDLFRDVHCKTQELTGFLDKEIGFPITDEEIPDYETLKPLFFKRFYKLAIEAIRDYKEKKK